MKIVGGSHPPEGLSAMTLLDCISSHFPLREKRPREALLHMKHPLSVHSATRITASTRVSITLETTLSPRENRMLTASLRRTHASY
jgi:hypothetical protein